MIKVGINGACGRMGARLVALVSEQKDMQLSAAIERNGHQSLGMDAGTANNMPATGVILADSLSPDTDVLIDFSSPDSSVQRAKECAEYGVALITGTTGLDAGRIGKIESISDRCACLIAPNMSLGVNLLFTILPKVARALGEEYDIEVVELHHRFKKDSPSGTALKLAHVIAEELGRDLDETLKHGRQGAVGERKQNEIGMHAVRGGDIVGEHTVYFAGIGERIEITHKASSRDTFCMGAIAAARFIAGKQPGLYTMEDVLGLG